MTLYSCECGKESKEISKATIVLREGKWVCKQAKCSCGLYMDSEPTEGIPNLKRTEASLSKKKRHEKLWAGAKEKLVGERGINESFD
mgnify:CR=1 FL=1|jgi:hypothetical protein|tara:strand:- start:14 stop:274 length:261 start_codon:yes stop_codon:yes gene_type:complete